MLLNRLSWALYGIRSTQKKNIYIYIYIYLVSDPRKNKSSFSFMVNYCNQELRFYAWPCVCSVIVRLQRTSKCGKNNNDTLSYRLVCHFVCVCVCVCVCVFFPKAGYKSQDRSGETFSCCIESLLEEIKLYIRQVIPRFIIDISYTCMYQKQN